MMNNEQTKVVQMVYTRFIESEVEGWNKIDDVLELLEFLSDEELLRESRFLCEKYSKGIIRCSKDHDRIYCFAPFVLEAVEAILLIEDLHPKNAYILCYFLAMAEMGLIYID